MRLDDQRESENVEDRRGTRGPKMLAGGGLGAVALLVIAYFLGADPRLLFNQMGQEGGEAGPFAPRTPEEEQLASSVKRVFATTEDVWTQLFRDQGKTYRLPRLVLFTGSVASACGTADAAVGPFYCSEDEQVYIDLVFYDELARRFHAPGDFAQAYVIAHEVGHHVQKLLGTLDSALAERTRASEEDANRLSVRRELQADFYAGVWAHHVEKSKHILDPGDIEEGLGAASAIGDDRLQKQSGGRVTPDSFTHGTSAQRVRWFKRGFETGDVSQGDTFSVRDL
jgi:uncharacterized protein